MRITKAEKWARFYAGMERYGISYEDANKLRRIELTLHRWAELECGDGNEYGSWAIERDEETDKPFRIHHIYGHGKFPDRMIRTRIADKEAGALRRLERILSTYPELTYYHQTDPRGCALYVMRKADIDTSDFRVRRNGSGYLAERNCQQGDTRQWRLMRRESTRESAETYVLQQAADSQYTRGFGVCVD